MRNTFRLPALSVVALSSVFANCGDPGTLDPAAGNVAEQAGLPSRIHIMPLTDPNAAPPVEDRQIQGAKTLKNYGGPVLKNVKVYPVNWGAASSIRCSATIDSSYTTMVASSIYTSLLPQYSAIGAGSNHATYSDTAAPTGTNISDAQIQTELSRLITAGSVPAPDGNTYYPIHFPSGRKITGSDGSQSCVQFCAYHGTYVRNGVNVYYGVIPDVGDSGCAGGCGTSTQCNNTNSVSSHELVEATTDPAVGLATVYGPPLGWYNATYGEIGDICNAQQGTVTVGSSTITVQKEWSNSKNACAVN